MKAYVIIEKHISNLGCETIDDIFRDSYSDVYICNNEESLKSKLRNLLDDKMCELFDIDYNAYGRYYINELDTEDSFSFEEVVKYIENDGYKSIELNEDGTFEISLWNDTGEGIKIGMRVMGIDTFSYLQLA